jgi:hypothetical protein
VFSSGEYHQESEDTHWTPFLNATVNYIRKHYQRPWDSVSILVGVRLTADLLCVRHLKRSTLDVLFALLLSNSTCVDRGFFIPLTGFHLTAVD